MSNINEKAIGFKVDSDFYKQIKLRILEKDMKLKEYIIDLIRKDLKQKEEQ